MADLKYTVQVDTRGAERNVNNLKETILDAGKILAGAFVIREIGQFISGTIQAASSVENLALTLETLYGNASEAGRALQIVEDSAARLPISLQAIQQGIPSLALVEDQFGGLQNAIEFTAGLATTFQLSFAEAGLQVQRALTSGINSAELLKDRGVAAFLGFQQGATYTAEQTRQAFLDNFDAIVQNNAKAANTITGQFSMLGDAALQFQKEVGEAFSDELKAAITALTTAFNENKDEILAFARAIGDGIGTAITFVIDNGKTLITVLSAAFGAAIAAKVITIAGAVLKLAASFKAAAISGTILQGVTGVGLVKVAAGIAAASGAVLAIEQMTKDAADAVGDLDDAASGLADMPTTNGPLSGDATSRVESHKDAILELMAPHLKFIQQAQKFAETDYTTDLEKANTRLEEAKAVVEGLTAAFESGQYVVEDWTKLINAANNELNAAQKEVTELTDAANELAREGTFEKFYDDVIEGAQETQKEIDFSKRALEDLEKAFLSGAISLEVYGHALEELEGNLGRSSQAMQDMFDTTQDFISDINQSTTDAQRNFQQLSMSPLARELDDIETRLRNDLGKTIEELNRAATINPELSDSYRKSIEQVTAATEEAIVAQQELARQAYETQRSFEYGWSRAFEEYADNATNSAKRAEKIFDQTTQGMEDMIVDFAKTGKLEWKSFVADMLETLLRSQLQSAMAQIFNIGTSGGSAGNVLGGLFAGFFANGGLIPGGSFGVVGENGPELVSGPAQVTPMTGGGPVTYNISAVDAQSFKQLVARDPGFIHAVASQGGKKVPVRR